MTFGETPALAKHLRRRHEGKRLSSEQEAQLALQFCSCQSYWGKGESINRHYRPHATARSQKHLDRCKLLGISLDSPLCSAPVLGVPNFDDYVPPSPTNHSDTAFRGRESDPDPLSSAPLCSAPDPAYVLTARVWRDLPRQFWPTWRAAVRPAFSQYLTATDPNAQASSLFSSACLLLFFPLVLVAGAVAFGI